MKITVIGGDERLRTTATELRALGYAVDSIGLYKDKNGEVDSSQVLLLPVPTTRDKIHIYAPLTEQKILLADIPKMARGKRVLCAGYTFPETNQIDYGKSDAYAYKNAVPTAEGAIRIAIERTPFTLWQSRVLVIGYGRVGKVLAERLRAFGCFVTVAARKPADHALSGVFGFETTDSTALSDLHKFDIIFNTVDVPILETAAKSLVEKCVIDLSSRGGLSAESAKQNRIDYCFAPGLPGKTAPVTAGKIVAETVHEILKSQ